jgi:hypothetical protein
LKVFQEELNDGNYTDFATTPITINTTALTLTSPDKTGNSGGGCNIGAFGLIGIAAAIFVTQRR